MQQKHADGDEEELVHLLLKEVDEDQWYEYIERLVSFNRWTFGAEIELAKEYIHTTLSAMCAGQEGIEISMSPISQAPHASNVYLIIKGARPVVPAKGEKEWAKKKEKKKQGTEKQKKAGKNKQAQPTNNPTGEEIVIIVGAHYDSTSEQPSMCAPGAVDNGSGTAAVMELCRIFSKHRDMMPSNVTLIFALYPGISLSLSLLAFLSPPPPMVRSRFLISN